AVPGAVSDWTSSQASPIGLPRQNARLPMPTTTVDTETFNALHLAQATLNYVRLTLTYGSANQIQDLRAKFGRDGVTPANGQTLPRLRACRDGVKSVMQLAHGSAPGWLDAALYRQGIGSGLAAYYRAGNCGDVAPQAWLGTLMVVSDRSDSAAA